MRTALAGIALMLVVGACGPVGTPATPAATASTVAVQPGDLPGGMTKCDFSGDINSYLKKIQAKDPGTYSSLKAEWDAAQKDGAIAADVEFYSDSAAHCTTLASNGSQVTDATYKLVVNFVIQFKDEASAGKGYTTDKVMGFSAASLKSGLIPVTEGTATGLGKNSIVLTYAAGSQSFYVAVWQNKQFMIILGVVNIDTATAKKVGLAENGRIH